MARTNYGKLYTLRSDGRYQVAYKDKDGKRKFLYDRDPKRLHDKLQEATSNSVVTFAEVADAWERHHREEIRDKTWKNYEPHVIDIVAAHGNKPIEDITSLDVINDLKIAHARKFSATIISTRRSIYRMILDYALVLGHIKYNPAIGVKMPKGIEKNAP